MVIWRYLNAGYSNSVSKHTRPKTSHIHPPRSLNRTSMHICASVHVDYNNVWVSSILSIAMKDFVMKNRYYFGILTITS